MVVAEVERSAARTFDPTDLDLRVRPGVRMDYDFVGWPGAKSASTAFPVTTLPKAENQTGPARANPYPPKSPLGTRSLTSPQLVGAVAEALGVGVVEDVHAARMRVATVSWMRRIAERHAGPLVSSAHCLRNCHFFPAFYTA